MDKDFSSEGIDGFFHRLINEIELVFSSNNTIQKRMQYLPYPNWNFNEKYLLEQICLQENNIFIPGQSVEIVKIETETISNTMKELNYPYLYKITVCHGSVYKWTIIKQYQHFINLHRVLVNYVQSQLKKSHNKLNNEKMNGTIKNSINSTEDNQEIYFPFENDPIKFINQVSIEKQCKLLQNYLNKLLEYAQYREHPALKIFLQISPLSFVDGLGESLREGYVCKKFYDDYHDGIIISEIYFIYNMFKINDDQKWFVIKDSYLVPIEIDSGIMGFPMLVDQHFFVDRNFNEIRVKNLQYLLIIKSLKEYERDQWFDCLMKIKTESIFAQQHLFNSFAPKRKNQYAHWLMNGQSFMEALAKGILAAREEIFIMDWWLSPELILVRPFQDESMRIDNLLGKKAEEGIRIYVIIYKDSSVMNLNSQHTKKTLMAKSPTKKNIKVIRYPDRKIFPGTKSSFFYTCHEKLIIIDQRLAFVGGTDLCWGRWDDGQYRLVDLGNENITELTVSQQMINQMEEQPQTQHTTINTTKELRENINNENLVKRSASKDYLDTIKQELSFDTINDYFKNWSTIFKKNKKDEEDTLDNDSFNGKIQKTKSYLFIGKDYANLYEKNFEDVEKYYQDYIDRKQTPRMPWHDETVVITGEAARDCARHFIQRWNIHKADKHSSKKSYPYLLPKSYDDEELSDVSFLRSILPNNQNPISVDIQCVRSASLWSCGIHTVEQSAENAHIHMIDNAEHFIYIENQFFITIDKDSRVKNGIADALYRRIIRAFNNKENFRIFIILPLLPGFDSFTAVQTILYFTAKSINKDENSLYQRLKQAGIDDPEQYIKFYGMRNWDILMGNLVTEIVYIHAKLMIVDDRICICGSVNINDRSLLGSRDSEFSVVINDTEMIDSQLNGQTQKVGRLSSTWRKKLFRHLLGIENEEGINVDDPCSQELDSYFRQVAKNNTRIYEEVFNVIPTNQTRGFKDLDDYRQRLKLKDINPQIAHEKCKQIQGFIVEYPVEFLIDDITTPEWTSIEAVAPNTIWT